MLYKPHVHKRSQGGHGLPKFLEYLVILCFKRQYLKQNAVPWLKSNILTPPNFWAGHASTAHVSTVYKLLFHWGKIGLLVDKRWLSSRLRTAARKLSIEGLDILEIWQKLHWFIVFHISILGRAWSFVLRVKPTKAPRWHVI